jgi:hypothetical protein
LDDSDFFDNHAAMMMTAEQSDGPTMNAITASPHLRVSASAFHPSSFSLHP